MTGRRIAVSRATGDALTVLGNQIKVARLTHQWTLVEVAERLGVDRRTVSNIEKGSPGSHIGVVFNAAFLVGVDLFGLTGPELAAARRRGEETLALLPRRVRQPILKDDVDDAF